MNTFAEGVNTDLLNTSRNGSISVPLLSVDSITPGNASFVRIASQAWLVVAGVAGT